jgi:hypothetical protein
MQQIIRIIPRKFFNKMIQDSAATISCLPLNYSRLRSTHRDLRLLFSRKSAGASHWKVGVVICQASKRHIRLTLLSWTGCSETLLRTETRLLWTRCAERSDMTWFRNGSEHMTTNMLAWNRCFQYVVTDTAWTQCFDVSDLKTCLWTTSELVVMNSLP